ncbi:MAG: hypothetical protein QG625_4498 [Cyanobacteriota bacterium erpe_2018_sw_39hr_WHONDRS-SW48-000098_B_bin.30]|jgi:hypothetical protein|nr:hypothetical protein [Cyanobacteriota bacterium erpe_2018_sw_39hr_WHONDRS-SW48-000098_B_bin.30]
MLVASKESIARVRGYKSPLLAAAIVLSVVYALGSGIFSMWVLQGEFRLAVPTVLKPGHNIFESDADTVYLLAKTYEHPDLIFREMVMVRQGRLETDYEALDDRARNFEVTCESVKNAHTPKLFWMTKSERISGYRYQTRVCAAFYMTKGQRMLIDVKWHPDAAQKNQQLKIVRLGVRMSESIPYYNYAVIKSGKFLSPGRLLSTDDMVINEVGPARPCSPLDLPLPLIGDGTQLKLKTRLLAGEQIKSSMLELPKSEEELKEFLAMRNLEVSEEQKSPGRDK